jgi:transketolase
MTANELDLKTVYVNCLLKLGEQYPNLVVLDADLASSTGTGLFGKRFPERFFDCGIQEADMAGVAAGLSVGGMLPIIHSFAAFTGRRMTDQVFLSCAYAKTNVRIVGADPGICAAKNGGTHMALEDVGILRTIPQITILDPSDASSLEQLLQQTLETPGVYYLRLNRKAKWKIYGEDDIIRIGKANKIMEGGDVTLIACGSICVPEAILAAEALAKKGVSARVLDMATVKPLDAPAVRAAAQETRAIITVENHNILNGLGSAVAEVLAESGTVPFARIGVPDMFGQVGSVTELQQFYGITAEAIEQKALTLLKR